METTNTTTETTEDMFGPVISRYTRAQAIEDGALVEVPAKLVAEAGFKLPVAMTTEAASWVLPKRMPSCQDATGRLWDTLSMLRFAVRSSRAGGEVVYFRVLFIGGRKPRKVVAFKCVCGPSDDGSPCMTIMMPEED